MTETRDVIATYIDDNPGTHFNELVRGLDFASGQVQHHVYRLLRDGQLVEERLNGRSHYYTEGYDEWERAAIALFRQETARHVLVTLLSEEACRPADVADRIGVARSTLEWHVDHLIEHDIVRKERDERGRVTLHLERPTATATLLTEITPRGSDRFVDRFMRLVDLLLEGE
jgi:predicted transcriptional regulator